MDTGGKSVKTAEISGFVSQGISTDGKMAILMADVGDENLAIALPTSMLGEFKSIISNMERSADLRNLPRGQVRVLKPEEYQVGHSDEMRGCTVLQFNPNRADELLIALPDDAAMKLAQVIVRDIGKRTKRIIIPGG